MMQQSLFVSFFFAAIYSGVGAFQVRPLPPLGAPSQTRVITHRAPVYLSNSSDDNEAAPSAKRRRKRVKRKEPIVESTHVKQESSDSTTQTPPADLKPRDDAPVELQIKDVRDVVSGTFPSSFQEGNGASSSQSSSSSMNLGDDTASSAGDDSLKQLLADAKAMRKDVAADASDKEADASIQENVRNILSTIVTIDFFVVCALLVWFLAGIFGSYILKNDAIQIAFNSIFQQVVQPALGILMIGSAASAVLKEEGQQD